MTGGDTAGALRQRERTIFLSWAHAEDAAEIIRLEQKRKAEDGQCPVEAGLQSDGCSAAPSKGEENSKLMK